MAITLTKQGRLEMISYWGDGLWSLPAFSMQMALVSVSGNAMVLSFPMQKLLKN